MRTVAPPVSFPFAFSTIQTFAAKASIAIKNYSKVFKYEYHLTSYLLVKVSLSKLCQDHNPTRVSILLVLWYGW